MATDRCIKVIAQAANMGAKEVKWITDHLKELRESPEFKERVEAHAQELERKARLLQRNTKLQRLADFRFKQRMDGARDAVKKELSTTDRFNPGKRLEAASWYDVGKSYLTGSRKIFPGSSGDAYHYSKAAGAWAQNETLANIAKIVGRKWALLFKDPGFNTLVAKELGGEETGNETAAAVAQVLRDSYRKQIERLNKAGGDVHELENYIFAQHHDPYKMAKAGPAKWIQTIRPLLKESIFRGEDPNTVLHKIYDNILQGTHDHPEKVKAGDFKRTSGLAKLVSRHRVFEFKNADALMDYDRQFGRNGEVLVNAVDQIRHMAENAAKMERLGPNPETFFNRMIDTLKHESRGGAKVFTAQNENSLRRQFNALTHADNRVLSYKLQHNFSVFRNLINLAHLGTSTISSFGDANNMALTLHYNGVPLLQSYLESIEAFAKHWAHPFKGGLVSEPERLARLSSLSSGIDGLIHAMAGRWAATDDTLASMRRLMGAYFKINGQSAWDDDMKFATAKALSTYYASLVHHSWKDLSPEVRRGLESSGLGEKDWDLMRKSKLVDVDGLKHLTPDMVKGDTGKVYAAHLLRNAETTVPLPGASQLAQFEHGQQGGWLNELVHTGLMFKSFPISLAMKMWPRIAEMGFPGYALATLGSIPFGYASIALKKALEGQDPPDWRKPDTTLESIIQAGAGSMLSDIVERKFSPTYTFADMVGGPAASTMSDILENAEHPLGSKPGHEVTPSMVNEVGDSVPFANLWFTKAAYHYLLLDQIQEALNPGYLQRMEATAKRKYDIEYFLKPSLVAHKLQNR